jgi:hypothetical protein
MELERGARVDWRFFHAPQRVQQAFPHGTVQGAVEFGVKNKAYYASETIVLVRLSGAMPDDARFGAVYLYDHASPDERDESHWAVRARGVTVERALARLLSRAYLRVTTAELRRITREFAQMTTLTPHQLL